MSAQTPPRDITSRLTATLSPKRTQGVRIEGLCIEGPQGVMVESFDFDIAPSQTLALIGESGSGKTLSARAIAGLLPKGFIARGRIVLGSGTVTLPASDAVWRATRGKRVSLLLQDPFTSLSPVHRCGMQIGITLEAHAGRRLPKAERAEMVQARLAEVNLPPEVAAAYPHELSGGMRQRVAIAAALATDPELLIADEPTTALDASNQGELLDLLRRLQVERGMSTLLISHDLGMVRGRAEQVLVMRRGQIMERGNTATVLSSPQHSYTRALIDADPSLTVLDTASTASIAGTVAGDSAHANPASVLVSASDISKSFAGNTVLRGVSIEVRRGESVGVVGESGSGKTTLARCIAGLETEDAGEVRFEGDILAPGRGSRRPEQIQIVFQDPYSSLNPMMSIGRTLRIALGVAGRPASDVEELLRLVDLSREIAHKRPAELSGGQRQRVAIARALAVSPELLICDESVSALDVSVQKQILALLSTLRAQLGLSVLFISHDLAVVRQVTDRVYVMRNGAVIESGSCRDVLNNPQHEYTRALVAASIHKRPEQP